MKVGAATPLPGQGGSGGGGRRYNSKWLKTNHRPRVSRAERSSQKEAYPPGPPTAWQQQHSEDFRCSVLCENPKNFLKQEIVTWLQQLGRIIVVLVCTASAGFI